VLLQQRHDELSKLVDNLAAGAFGYARRDLLTVPEALKQDVKVGFG
jgi:hypothetical protein